MTHAYAILRSKQTTEKKHVSTHQSQKVCHMQQPSLSLAHNKLTIQRWLAERGNYGPSTLSARRIPYSHPLYHYIRSPAQAATTKAPHSTLAGDVLRAIPSSTFSSVSLSTGAVTAFVQCLPCCDLPFASLCAFRPSPPRLSMILLAELLSMPRTHCATFSPKSIIMHLAPTKLIHL